MRKILPVLLLATTSLYAQLGADNKPIQPTKIVNPEFTECGKRFNQKFVWDLDEKQRRYRDMRTQAEYQGSGLDVIVQSTRAMQPCSMAREWYEKSTTITINGEQYDFITPGLFKTFTLTPEGTIVVKGTTYEGTTWEQIVDYKQ
jgi:hypothetical protein